MNIKTKLITVVLVICGAYIVMSGIIYLLFYRYQQSVQKLAVTEQVMTTVFERRFLADEYVVTRSERSRLQWLSKQHDLEQIVSQGQNLFKNEEEHGLILKIQEEITLSENTFNQIVVLYQNDQSLLSSAEKIQRLSSQLAITAQQAVSNSLKLVDSGKKESIENFQEILWLLGSFSSLLLVILLVSFRIIWIGAVTLHKRKTEDEAILQGIGDGVVVIDRSWKIQYFNKAASDISGWAIDEARGKSFREVIKFLREADRSENIEFIEEAMLMAKVFQMQGNTVLVKKDGTETAVGDSAAPIFDVSGNVIGGVIIFRDATEEREFHRLQSDFAYASHQLRTPVTKAIWSIETAQAEKDPAKIQEQLNTAYLSMKSMQKLTSQLLEASELNQGMIVIKKQMVDVNSVITEALKSNKQPITDKNITVTQDLAKKSVLCSTDLKCLTRVVAEVVDNAIIYNKPGGKIEIEVAPDDNGLSIEVTSTGIGINEEQQSLVFTKFFRGSNFDTTTIAGVGLGLYISREYLKLLKGKIWFKSSKDNTVFTIYLPA